MIVYRCVACHYDHKALSQTMQPQCMRCGGGSFAQMHLPDPDAVELDAEPPATPRDGPIVLEGPPPPPLEAEVPEVSRLRGVLKQSADECSQGDCDNRAEFRFTWPGHPEQHTCGNCSQRAVRVANAMGFYLDVISLRG